MHPMFLLLAAVVGGWVIQLYFTYKQSMAFNHDVRRLRTSGKVSVGVSGKRYRGGRAFVAIAVDDFGIVRDAITLRGFTTFARSRPLPELFGLKVNQVKGTRDVPHISRQQREAARQAAELLKPGREQHPERRAGVAGPHAGHGVEPGPARETATSRRVTPAAIQDARQASPNWCSRECRLDRSNHAIHLFSGVQSVRR